jgi:hypothetical protein
MTFPNLTVATLRVARITQRDSSNGATREVQKKIFGSWWSTCHRW